MAMGVKGVEAGVSNARTKLGKMQKPQTPNPHKSE